MFYTVWHNTKSQGLLRPTPALQTQDESYFSAVQVQFRWKTIHMGMGGNSVLNFNGDLCAVV